MMAESMTSKYHSVLLLLWVSIDFIQVGYVLGKVATAH